MDWKLQLFISIVVPIISSVLTYLSAIKKSKNDVEGVKISAENEINKIKEESEKELKRIQKETDELIRLRIMENELSSKTREDELKNQVAANFMDKFLNNPKQSMEAIKGLQDLKNFFSDETKKDL